MPTCPTCRTHFEAGTARCTKDGDTLLPDEAFTGADVDLRPGEGVGEYRIEGKLGQGGFGTVYAAVHPLIGKRCALKTLHRQFSSNPQMVSRFIDEARAVNQIRHRNIIDIFSFGTLPDGRQYYLMELLDGVPFDKYLEQKGPIPPEQALRILRPIARALDAAHGAGIAHRDLKPENIILTFDEDGIPNPKLLDFGIAKLLGEGTSGHKTRTGAPMGTPAYMSPEQCRGTNVDHRTDIYAFGVLCFQVLTGKLPFDGDAVMDILVKHMNAPPPKASEVMATLDPRLDAPVQHMLAKEAEGRPASVGAALDELASAARGAGHSVPVAVISSPGSRQTLGVNATLPVSSSATPPDLSNRTFLPAESDVGRPRGGGVVAVAGVGLLLAAVAGVAWSLHGKTPVAAPPPREQAATTTTLPIATSLPSAAAPVTAPVDVEISVVSNVPGTGLYLGANKVTDAPGPLRLPTSTSKTTLTARAPGYVPATVEVVPTENATVTVTLVKAKPASPIPHAPPHGAVSKDLEEPDLR